MAPTFDRRLLINHVSEDVVDGRQQPQAEASWVAPLNRLGCPIPAAEPHDVRSGHRAPELGAQSGVNEHEDCIEPGRCAQAIPRLA